MSDQTVHDETAGAAPHTTAAEPEPPQPIPAPSPPPAPPAGAGLGAELAALRASVDGLATTVGREHERAGFREAVIDRLHAENQQLRRGELESLLAPVRGGLFRLHDRARRAAEQCQTAAALTQEQAGAFLTAIADEAVDVLVGVGVERFDPQPGEAYDAGRHRPVGTVPVAEPWRHNTVAQVRTAGFATAERTLRRAEVVVATHQPPAAERPADPAAERPTDPAAERPADEEEAQ